MSLLLFTWFKVLPFMSVANEAAFTVSLDRFEARLIREFSTNNISPRLNVYQKVHSKNPSASASHQWCVLALADKYDSKRYVDSFALETYPIC